MVDDFVNGSLVLGIVCHVHWEDKDIAILETLISASIWDKHLLRSISRKACPNCYYLCISA